MLEEKDLQAIRQIITEINRENTNMILKELDLVQTKFNLKADKIEENIEENIEELKQYYKITKLENENTTLLLQMIRDLKAEVDELKQKIA